MLVQDNELHTAEQLLFAVTCVDMTNLTTCWAVAIDQLNPTFVAYIATYIVYLLVTIDKIMHINKIIFKCWPGELLNSSAWPCKHSLQQNLIWFQRKFNFVYIVTLC